MPAAPLPTVGTGATGWFQSGMVAGVVNRLNLFGQWINLITQFGTGNGILTGLDLVAGPGLQVQITPGVALGGLPSEWVSTGASGPCQWNIGPGSVALDNSLTYFWLGTSGGLIATGSTAIPPGGLLFLGTVTAASGAVTNIDYSGRITATGCIRSRQLADIGPPTDAPPQTGLVTITPNGRFWFDGAVHQRLINPTAQNPRSFAVKTGLSTYAITAIDPELLWFVPAAVDCVVTLPDPSTLTPGFQVKIVHAGTGENVVIKSPAGATLASLAPGQAAIAAPIPGPSALPNWPSSLTVTAS